MTLIFNGRRKDTFKGDKMEDKIKPLLENMLRMKMVEQEEVEELPDVEPEEVEEEPKDPTTEFTTEEVEDVAVNKLSVDLNEISLDQLVRGANHELEHLDVTGGEIEATVRIALAHIQEIPDYYDRLERMEEEYEAEVAEGSEEEIADES